LLVLRATEFPRRALRVSDAAPPISGPLQLSLSDLQLLIAVVGLYGDPKAPPQRTNARAIERLDESWAVVSLAAEVIDNWEKVFPALLDWLRAESDDGSTLKLGRSFGRLYNHLYSDLQSNQFHFAHNAMERYLAEHWPSLFMRSNGRFDKRGAPARWIPATEVRKFLGVSVRILDELIDKRLLRADKRLTVTGRVRIMVERESMNAYAESSIHGAVDLAAAARTLGLKRSRLRSLVEDLFPNAWKTSSGVWHIPETDLAAVAGFGAMLLEISRVDPTRCSTLDRALRYQRLTTQALAYIIRKGMEANGDRILARIAGMRGIPAWVVPLDFIQESLTATAPRDQLTEIDSISVPELATRLGVKQEVAYSLVRHGAFDGVMVAKGVERGVKVPTYALDAFNASYVSAQQIAANAGTSARNVIRRLQAAKLLPAFGGIERPCRQVFFAKTVDLAHALARNRLSGNLAKETLPG